MYRNEDKRAIADKWQGWADLFQFGTLGLLFVFMFTLDALPKETAKVFVWYGAAFLFITATIGFVLGNKALKYRMTYLNAEHKRVSSLFDKAIAYAKKHKL
jgi:hypothetical protein